MYLSFWTSVQFCRYYKQLLAVVINYLKHDLHFMIGIINIFFQYSFLYIALELMEGEYLESILALILKYVLHHILLIILWLHNPEKYYSIVKLWSKIRNTKNIDNNCNLYKYSQTQKYFAASITIFAWENNFELKTLNISFIFFMLNIIILIKLNNIWSD